MTRNTLRGERINETAQNRHNNTWSFTCIIWNIVYDSYIWRHTKLYIDFHLWPLILVALGMEILYYNCLAPEKAGTYDFAAIIILIMIVFFAMCMAGFDMVLTNMPKNIWDKWW